MSNVIDGVSLNGTNYTIQDNSAQAAINEIGENIVQDTTGQRMADALELIALSHAGEIPQTINPRTIREITRAGLAPKYYDYGDQINVTWNNGTDDFVLPFDVVAFYPVVNKNGDTVPGLWLQSHYALEPISFDGNEAFYVSDDVLPAGTYHFSFGNTWGSNVVSGKSYQFALANAVPAGGQLLLGSESNTTSGLPDNAPSTWRVWTFATANDTTPIEKVLLEEGTDGTDLGTITNSIKYGTTGLNNLYRIAYGYNRWGQCAYRQWLNSDSINWWSSQNPYDHEPIQRSTYRGFMAGLPSDFLEIVEPVKITTALNTYSDSDIGTSEDTYDKFFLPSLEQEYIVPQLVGTEGGYWPYWKERLDLTSPQPQGASGTNPNHIRYAYNAISSAQLCRLRSAIRGYSPVWYVHSTGTASYGYAAHANRGCPACVIC